MGFFVFIFFLVTGVYLLQWLFRLWLRWRIRKLQRQMTDNAQQGFGRQYSWSNTGRRERPAREGEIKVETKTAPGKKINDRIGDYVDYEEVEIIEESQQAN